jgi:outer membrane protein assembly factor BamB
VPNSPLSGVFTDGAPIVFLAPANSRWTSKRLKSIIPDTHIQSFFVMKTLITLSSGVVTAALFVLSSPAADWPQWRGPQRNGMSKETGLLKEWPEGGPKLLWSINDAGSGYAAPSIVGERLFVMGNKDLENEFVAARSTKDGKLLWEKRVGKVGNPDQKPPFAAARSTPTVDGELLYALGSDGDLACLEKDSGKIRWQKNLRSDFGGKPGVWAYSESPLVDGNLLICTPGGREAVMVALDKKDGGLKWKTSLSEEDAAAYSSPIIVEAGGKKEYVQMLGKALIGVDAGSGQPLWRYEKTVSRYNANVPTPVARGANVYSAGAGTGGGLVKLVKADGIKAEEVYFSPKLPTAIGGSILLGDYLYGTGNAGMTCSDFATGELKWEDRAKGPAAMCFADDRLYLNAESGVVALVEPSSERYIEKGQFTPPGRPKPSQQMEKPWAYPVVADGRLYLRDHAMLWCYDVRKP